MAGCLCMANLDDDLTCPRQFVELTADHLRGFLKDLHMEKIKPEEWNAYCPEKFSPVDWFVKNGMDPAVDESNGLEIYKVSAHETVYYDKMTREIGFYDRRDPDRKWSDFRMTRSATPEDEEWKRVEQRMYEDFN